MIVGSVSTLPGLYDVAKDVGGCFDAGKISRLGGRVYLYPVKAN